LSRTKESGFTLLEIMLAISILGLVVAMVTSSLSASIKAIDATIEQGKLAYQAQVAMERITEDLSSALLTNDWEFLGEEGSSNGDQGILLSFSSLAHLVFDPENDNPGVGRISYAVQTDQQHAGHLLLLRSDVLQRPKGDGNEDDEVEAFLLTDRLRSISFTYYDHLGESQKNWDTTAEEDNEEAKAQRRLPAAVSCQMEFWVDQEEQQTQTFQTTVFLPFGFIQAQPEED